MGFAKGCFGMRYLWGGKGKLGGRAIQVGCFSKFPVNIFMNKLILYRDIAFFGD
jgi:hypothetical protein